MKRILQQGFCLMACLLFYNFSVGQNYNFLGPYTPDGTPLYFVESDVVSLQTLTMIGNALPEGYPVPQYNPQYITSGYDTDIVIEELADVWVTFVAEGAGYKNVLGFYTYDINNPPTTTPQPEDITIIFPNVSALGSGGSLITGHKVHIGQFPPGTGIGWVLLANGWNGSVTPGLWQLFSNPDFNPEANPNLRHHNVLLNDPDNERIILGFEDIRRDNGGCDNDFNDALFYITSNPYTAIKTANFSKITDYNDVSSANDGGLESNGDLASLIAKRNFDRKKQNTFKNEQSKQQVYSTKTFKKTSKSGSLNAYFPETGMYGTETTYVSSPEDLIDITNADKIFSIDYYEGEERVSAALATETFDGVYNHSKTICDRLNDSKLLDVRTVTLQGHKLVYSQLERANRSLEYALTFSVKDNGSDYKVYSLWNIDEYPEGHYLNFQVWGSSMSQVSNIVNNIIDNLEKERPVSDHQSEDVLPTVFIKNGYYKQGKLYLNVVNKSKASSMSIDTNFKVTEQDRLDNKTFSVALSGAWEEQVEVPTGHLFDVGLSLVGDNSPQYDAIYLADGPWGVDFREGVDKVTDFNITPHDASIDSANVHVVERNVAMKGEVKETINIFRSLMAGDMSLDVEKFEYLQFKMKNDRPIEISLVTDATDDWNDRLRFKIPANKEGAQQSIALDSFTSAAGKGKRFTKLKSIVFSIQGDYQNYSAYEIGIENVQLSTQDFVPEIEVIATNQNVPGFMQEVAEVQSYPNPFVNSTVITVPKETDAISIFLSDLNGRVVYKNNLKTMNDKKSIKLDLHHLQNGIYVYTIVDVKHNTSDTGKIIKE